MNKDYLEPRGQNYDIERLPMTERVPLKGKQVFVIDIGRPNSDVLAEILCGMLRERMPNTDFRYYSKSVGYQFEEPDSWWEVIKKEANAAVVLLGDCGSCTMRTITIESQLETMGVPSVSIITKPFIKGSQNVANTVGMPSIRRAYMRYPIADMTPEFLKESLDATINQVIDGLNIPFTEEEKVLGTIKAKERKGTIFTGTEDEAQRYYMDNGMTDGLPIIPPTQERVEAMLKGTSHSPDEIIGKMPPEYLGVTIHQVAVNAVMAGCRPEYLPALLAMTEALIDPMKNINVCSRSTTSFAFWSFVNGPFAKEIGMNSAGNALGPGNHANATIGRAVRLFLVNLGGSEEGVNEMASLGNPLKYGFAFAENEEESPWTPYHVDKGFRPDESTITIATSWGFRTQSLSGFGKMGLPNIGWCAQNTNGRFGLGPYEGLFLVIDPLLAKDMARDGYTKRDIQEYLYDNLTQTIGEWKQSFSYTVDLRANLYPKWYSELKDSALIHRFEKPECFEIVVAGGQTSPFFQIYDGYTPRNVITKSIDKWR